MRRKAILIAAIAVIVASVVYATRAGDSAPPGDGRSRAPGVPSGPPGPAFSATVEIVDPDQGTGRIEWKLERSLFPTSASTVVGYEVEVVVNGRSVTPTPMPVAEPFVETGLWSGFGEWDADVPFELRLRAQFDDGAWSPPLSQHLVLPSVVPFGEEWVVGRPEMLVRNPGARHDLTMWIDGSIGFAELDSGVRAFGANGPRTSSWDVGSEAFVDRVIHTDQAIGGQDDAYAAGGPVYVHTGEVDDPDDDRLIMIYHGEDHEQAATDPSRWWGYLGMAISDDEGETFVDAGTIIAPNLPVTTPLERGIEVGGGAYVIIEDDGVDYFTIFFRDTLADGTDVKLAAARAPVAAVVAAAEACEPARPVTCVAPRFAKFDGTGWDGEGVTDSGLSGDAPADLFGAMGFTPTPVWFDVVELSRRGLYVLLFSWFVPSDVPAEQSIDGWSYGVSVSTDGLDWSRPVRIIETDTTYEQAYVTLTGQELSTPRIALTDELVIYRTRTEYREPGPPGRWAGDVFVERLTLSYAPPTTPVPGWLQLLNLDLDLLSHAAVSRR